MGSQASGDGPTQIPPTLVADEPDNGSDLGAASTPRNVGPYALLSLLGTGGMGAVWRARAPDGTIVALKLVHAAFRSQSVAARFAREASVRIEHPNVIRVLDAGADPDGTPYIVFELLEGEGLDTRLDRGTVEASVARDLGLQICAGLGAAHARGIVHRDLKPANVFVTSDGVVKVLDFGIALDVGRETRLTSTGGILGTPSYLAPEQAQGRLDVDARADVWALGTLLYAAVAGKPPFERETPLATILAIVREEPVPLATTARAVPPAFAAVVERALRKPKEQRWTSIAEMAAALRAADLTESPRSLVPGPRVSLLPEGEQRVVAVLLADGVTREAELERAVVTRGGVLVPLLGGRAVGLFGAERWEGDEARRAVEAALAARDAAVRVSVASGRAMLRGAAISGSVLTAAEAGCAADVRGVAVDAETARSLGARFATGPTRDGVVEVLGPADATADAVEPRTRTLGRDAELAQLQQALDSVVADRRALSVLVGGPLGIGKSRLRGHVEQMLAASSAGFRVLTARGEPRQRDVSLSLFAALVESHARRVVSGTTGLVSRGHTLVELVRQAVDDDVEERAAFLGELVGVTMPSHAAVQIARGDAQLMADRLRVTLADWLCGLAARGPLALVLEDLQWADAASLALLSDVLEQLEGTTFLLFATTRPELLEAHPELLRGSEQVRIMPRGLSAADVATLAAGIAGEPLAEPLVRAVAERTGGNPLFVEQIVTALREDGLLRTGRVDLLLPVTVEAAIQSRLDHLPAPEKDLCKRAAIFGRPFSTEELSSLGVADAGELLASLGRRELVGTRARGRGGRRDHAFRSALVGEVAYRMISDEPRLDLHRRAAAHLAQGETPDHEEIASHHERGDEPGPAAARYADAALAAARLGDGPTVVRCAGHSLRLGAPAELLFALHTARADALGFLGRFDEMTESLTAALAAATTHAERAETLGKHATLAWRVGRASESLDLASRGLSEARAATDPDVLARALSRQGFALLRVGRLAEARVALDEATSHAAHGSPLTRAIVAQNRAELAGTVGDLGARRQEYAAAAELFAECGDLRRRASAEANLADVYNRFGAYADAERALRVAAEGCRRVGNRVMEGYALGNLAYSLVHLGRAEEAVEALRLAETLAADGQEVQLGIFVRLYRLGAELGRISPAESVAHAESVAADAGAAGNRAVRALALGQAARASLAAGAADRAVALAMEAVSIVEELGGLEEDEGEVFLTCADALVAAGRDATDVRARGRHRIEQIAAGIADGDWRERFLRDVPAHRALVT